MRQFPTLAWGAHYHRRYGVSLLSSAWVRWDHRASAAGQILVLSTQFFITSAALPALAKSVILLYAPSFLQLALAAAQIVRAPALNQC